MTKLMILLGASAAAVAGSALSLPGAAAAQNEGIAEIIVYGTDPCPRSTDDQVVVCARKPESERFRIPERYRQSGSRQSRESWANKALAFETYGRTGINSCSPVGPGGFTGCMTQIIDQARQERREQVQSQTAPDE